MSSPSSDEGWTPPPLNIERCASLHDTIAALHLTSPYLHPRCRLQKDFWTVHNSEESLLIRERLTPELNEYLAEISVFAIGDGEPDPGGFQQGNNIETPKEHGDYDERPQKRVRLERRPVEPSFTPALLFPYPHQLFRYEEWPVEDEQDDQILESTVVLLYASIHSRGGLFFDMSTNLCCWAIVDGNSWPQRPTEWVPLEYALQRYLSLWENGRYVMAPKELEPEGCDFAKPYVESELEETLREWESLLSVVESRMLGRQHAEEADSASSSSSPQQYLLSPEDLEDTGLLQRLNLMPSPEEDADHGDMERDLVPSFLLSFLSRATRPNHPNLRIAPGITYFNLSSMRASLLADGDRRQGVFDQRGDMTRWFERPILLFPCADEETGRGKITEWEEWQRAGWKNLLFDRRAGLYFSPAIYAGWFDTVKFISQRPVEMSMNDVTVNVIQDVEEDNDVGAAGEEVEIRNDSELQITLAMRSDTGSAAREGESSDEERGGLDHPLSNSGEEDRGFKSRRGNDVLFSHDNFFHCPFFGQHHPRLVDVLRAWRRLVESNVVTVGPDGVNGTLEDIWEQMQGPMSGRRKFDLGRCW